VDAEIRPLPSSIRTSTAAHGCARRTSSKYPLVDLELQSLLSCILFEHAYPGQGRYGKYDARRTKEVGLVLVALEKIARRQLPSGAQLLGSETPRRSRTSHR